MAKVDIFSGFLGAGKTTLIRKLIKEAYAGEQIVLIENEFGEIAIDGGFLADAGVKINEMSSGCICCSLVGDFKTALRQVVADYAPDRILIEPSGVGKLSDVIKAVIKADDAALELDGFVAVADANKAKVYMKNFGEFFNDQIENAGTIVLSRTGDISEAKLAEAVALIRQRNEKAVIITTPWDQLSGEQMKEAIERRVTLNAELEKLKAEQDEHHHHHHHDDDDGDEHGHHHHHHHHHHHDADEVFTSWGVETTKKFTADGIRAILEELDDIGAYGIVLRAKGIVAGEDGEWIHFDFVPDETNVRTGPAAITGRLCVIGSKLAEDRLKELFGV